jgi:SAM-dependent methyltransferase
MLPSATELLGWLASLPPGARDAALEEHLGIGAHDLSTAPPGKNLIGYHPSGVAPIVQALLEVPVRPDDVFIDLGSGLGKVVLLAAILTGATARGIELQPLLVQRAHEAATRLGVSARFDVGDARDAPLDDGTVFFLYAPFTRDVLRPVLSRLREVAVRREIVVCALGVDLEPAPWLARRDLDSFWLAIYDSRIAGGVPRPAGRVGVLAPAAEAIAREL